MNGARSVDGELEGDGLVSRTHMLWNINAHMVTATPAAIQR